MDQKKLSADFALTANFKSLRTSILLSAQKDGGYTNKQQNRA
jgi:hypothetical protein